MVLSSDFIHSAEAFLRFRKTRTHYHTRLQDCIAPLLPLLLRWTCSKLLLPELGGMQLLPSLLQHPMLRRTQCCQPPSPKSTLPPARSCPP